MEQHRTLTVDGRTVHYRDEGRDNSHTLVLLHGFLQNLDVWSSYVLSYMNHMRVITIDLPGHGLTDTFCDVHTMDFMAKVVKDVLTEAGVDQCVMVGHSMGGYVTLAFADRYPYTLRGLGLINSHALADTDEHRRYRDEVCRQVQDNRASYIVGFVPSLFDDSKRAALSHDIKDLQEQCLLTTTASIVAAQRGMAARHSRIQTLAALEVPTLFIYGKNDPRIPLELAVSGAMVARHAEMLLLDGVAHMAFMEERDYVKPRISNFVETCYY
ncbi:MAG: alpha/beta fold hydrolase [Bacteroidales bacterium]|nr:alpha/beta fold hydrolase [Bacteroidales bacterium]